MSACFERVALVRAIGTTAGDEDAGGDEEASDFTGFGEEAGSGLGVATAAAAAAGTAVGTEPEPEPIAG